MSSRHLTLDRRHPDFEKYIFGTFSKTERAVPVQSLNVNTLQEQVTFEIRDVKDIEQPGFFSRTLQILKAKNFTLVLFPLFLILVKNIFDESIEDIDLAVMSGLAALFLHIAVNLTNDVQDHVRGLDRLVPNAGSRALQKGWTTAQSLRRASFFYLFFGALLALPSLIQYPEIWWTVLPLAVLGLAGLLSYRAGLKYRAWSEWVIFLMLGPLLTTGYQLSFGGGFDLEVVFIGVLTGWLAVFLLHLRNWQQLVISSQAQFNNSVTRFGFEKSKKFIQWWWCGFVVLFVIYHGIYAPAAWQWVVAFGSVLISTSFLVAMSDVESPLGSRMQIAVSVGHRVVAFISLLWFFEVIWIYFITEFWI
jgi:1,4-dihydroxy-2-naphthoate octaprenyltransferase